MNDQRCDVINPRKGWACELAPGHTGRTHKTRTESGEDWYDWQVELTSSTPPTITSLAPLPMLKFETIPLFPAPVINATEPEPDEGVLPWTPPVLSGIVHYERLEGPRHTCRVPDADQFGGGTIHRCEGCGKYRRVKLLPLASVRVRKGLFGKSYEQVARMWEDISEERALELIGTVAT